MPIRINMCQNLSEKKHESYSHFTAQQVAA